MRLAAAGRSQCEKHEKSRALVTAPKVSGGDPMGNRSRGVGRRGRGS